MKTLRKVAATAAMTILLLTAACIPAHAATTMRVAFTRIGIYPRAAASMASAKVGAALPDGSYVTVACEAEGEPVSNGDTTISVWEKLSDGTWLPNAFIDSGYDGYTPGVPRCDAVESATSATANWAPTDAIMVEWNYSALTPREPNDPSHSSWRYAELTNDWHNVDVHCRDFAALGLALASSFCRHYLDRTGEDRYLDMPTLIDDERPLWASFEHSIRWEVNDLMDDLRGVPSNEGRTFTFTSGWQGYSISATAGDWWAALGHINWAARGDVSIGPADANGDRPVQIRYRPFVEDMYDFGTDYPSEYRLAEVGWANPFLIRGVGNQRIETYQLASLDPWSIPFTP